MLPLIIIGAIAFIVLFIIFDMIESAVHRAEFIRLMTIKYGNHTFK